jgi:phospholipid/cholesterol/gamma-HCH transport system permease protein
MKLLERIGVSVRERARRLFYATGFFLQVLRHTPGVARQRHVSLKGIVLQILFTGYEAFGIVALVSLAIGAIIIVQGISLLPRFGQGELVYQILIIVIVRELGPILTAFIINARSGTAIATELGSMVISHEVEAYVAVGVDPISYLVVPRFLGVTISVVVLTIYFSIFGLFGSYIVTQLVEPIPLGDYTQNLLSTLQLVDILSTFIKSLVFGIIISVVSTFEGFAVDRSSTEIPQRVIRAVSRGFVLCFVANAIITLIYYF